MSQDKSSSQEATVLIVGSREDAKLLASVQELVARKYPGIALESAVQGWFYLGDYQQGVDTHKALYRPSFRDDRWLGECYGILRQRDAAKEALLRAVARGEEAARIQLARVLGFMERGDEASQELEKVNRDRLKPADKVLWYRAKSIYEDRVGYVQNALAFAEEAWRLVQGLPEFPILAPWVLIRLGRLHSQVGRAQRANWFFGRAREVNPNGDSISLQMARAEGLITLGRYEEALQRLGEVDAETLEQVPRSVLLMLQANVAWSLGNKIEAIHLFDRAASEALNSSTHHTEFLSRLALIGLLSTRNLFRTAYEHLRRAKTLVDLKYDQLQYRFRELQFRYYSGDIGAEAAADEYRQIARAFEALGLLQEEGWARLHLAEMYRLSDDDRYELELDKLQGISVALQNPLFLAREWVLLPELREVAIATHPKIAGRDTRVLEVYSMGEEKLVLDGKVIHVRLRRALEILAYLLEHQEVSLKGVLVDIFGDEKPKTARSYFHQFRHELHERLAVLSVDFDAEQRVYRLNSKAEILWDVAELRAGRRMGSHGIFLPGSGSPWVEQIDSELEPLRNASVLSLPLK